MPQFRHVGNKQQTGRFHKFVKDVILAYSKQQQAFMQKYHVELLTDFSGYSPIQIIYKPQLVYYLHKLFLIFQVKYVSLLMALPLLVSSFTSLLCH